MRRVPRPADGPAFAHRHADVATQRRRRMRRHERRRERVDRLRTSAARQDDPPKVGTLCDAGSAVDAAKAGDAHALVRRDARARPRVAPHRRALRDVALRPSTLDELRPRGRRLAAAAGRRQTARLQRSGRRLRPAVLALAAPRRDAPPAVAAAAGTHRRRHAPPPYPSSHAHAPSRHTPCAHAGRQRRSSSHAAPPKPAPHTRAAARAPLRRKTLAAVVAARFAPLVVAARLAAKPAVATADSVDAVAAAGAVPRAASVDLARAPKPSSQTHLARRGAERSGRARDTPRRSARPSRSRRRAIRRRTRTPHARVAVARAAASAARVGRAVGA